MELYPDRKWSYFDTFYKGFECDAATVSHDELPYFFYDSAFVSPVIPVMAKHMRSLSRCESDFSEKCKTLYKDTLDSFNFNFHPDNFKRNTGFFFPEMMKNTDLYIDKASPKFKNRLKELKDNGVKIVLVTASHVDYTELLMDYSYGSNWREYFDIVCCRARKPGFFTSSPVSRPFYRWNFKNDSIGTETMPELNCKDIFFEGHWTCVDKWIKCNATRPGRVAYVGDSFKSDIIPTKLFTSWDQMAIVWEGQKCLREKSTETFDHVNKKVHLEETKEWGSFFGSEKQFTMTAGKLMAHSDIVFSNVESLASLEMDEGFESGCFYDFDPYE